jgi:phytoene dehydrogenase-like protein
MGGVAMMLHTAGEDKSIAIVGGGIAGLCAGIYAQMNGYRSRIYEMHTTPGGVMTAWERKGYTIDYCIHWLVGSSPKSSMYKLWQEVGLLDGVRIVDLDVWAEYESSDGRKVTFWCDLDRLESHLCEIAPRDAEMIRRLLKDARRIGAADMLMDLPPRELMRARDMIRLGPRMLPWIGPMRRWGKLSIEQLVERLNEPLLRDALRSLWPAESGAIFLIGTFGWLDQRIAGYPIGGSLPLARNLEARYTSLGGEIRYGARVEEILTERTGGIDRSRGVRLADGSEEPAEVVISAADGHATIYDMLGGRYLDDEMRGYYERGTLPLFPAILFVGLGVGRSFADEPKLISGRYVPLDEPIGAGSVSIRELPVRIVNFDPTLAPDGKTAIYCFFEADGDYWCRLRDEDRERYRAEKARVGDAVVRALDRRYPGLAAQVEMIDVATPATTVRYTGNWKGSFEGWLPTAEYLTKSLPKRLPGLDDFYMAGQWVQPGGGLPSGLMSAREALQLVCSRDGKAFRTTTV